MKKKNKRGSNLFQIYYPNKKLEELYNSELLKEKATIPQKFLTRYKSKDKQ